VLVQCTSAATRLFTSLYSDTGLLWPLHPNTPQKKTFAYIAPDLHFVLSSPLPQRTRSPRTTLSYATQAPCPCQVWVLSLRIRLRKLSILARAAIMHSLDANMPISVTQRSHKPSCREVLATIQFQRYAELSVVWISTAASTSLSDRLV
jgi:hypothetical protein